MKLYGLIGFPLTHSFSKKYFEEKFAKERIMDCRFELFPLKNINGFVELIKTEQPCGIAVTIPYKETVIPFLTNIDSAAKEIGAVNCISFSEDGLKGYNTDAIGFEQSLLPLLKPYHSKALVLGTGGSSKAVQYVLKKNNIDFLTVSRNANAHTITYDKIDAGLMQSHTLIINCTPLGMAPDTESSPAIPYDLLTERHLLYDLIYVPEKTKFLRLGEERGAAIKNGFEMLVLQAEENWKIWEG